MVVVVGVVVVDLVVVVVDLVVVVVVVVGVVVLECGSCHIRNVLIGVEYQNCCRICMFVYLLLFGLGEFN